MNMSSPYYHKGKNLPVEERTIYDSYLRDPAAMDKDKREPNFSSRPKLEDYDDFEIDYFGDLVDFHIPRDTPSGNPGKKTWRQKAKDFAILATTGKKPEDEETKI